MRTATWIAALAACAAGAGADAATLIHAGRLIDGVADTPRERVTVIVEGDRIRAIEDGFTAAGAGDSVVDLSDATVLPGLMDMHVHLTSEHSRRSELDNLKKSEADRAYDSVLYAERTLLAGFTTVRNVGDQWNVSIALRRAIADGKVTGPRIFTSGRSIGTRGGHADSSNSWGPFLSSDDPRLDTVCNGPDSCREAVRRMTASISASYHMLSAPEAPAPTATATSATKPSQGWMPPGAATMPTRAVKRTSDITRGFIRAR